MGVDPQMLTKAALFGFGKKEVPVQDRLIFDPSRGRYVRSDVSAGIGSFADNRRVYPSAIVNNFKGKLPEQGHWAAYMNQAVRPFSREDIKPSQFLGGWDKDVTIGELAKARRRQAEFLAGGRAPKGTPLYDSMVKDYDAAGWQKYNSYKQDPYFKRPINAKMYNTGKLKSDYRDAKVLMHMNAENNMF